MFHLILRRRRITRITRSNISNTRRSVSFDIKTPISDISNTRKSVSFDIKTPISDISNTRRSVSSDIQTPRNSRRRISNYR